MATLVAIVFPLLALAALRLRRAARPERRRVVLGAILLGLFLTTASAMLWSQRHAGTGTETARGWPRVVYARWMPFEGGAGRAGLQWRGVAEGGLVYLAAAAALLAFGPALGRRRRPVHSGGPSVPT
jgi:hypothetical protein